MYKTFCTNHILITDLNAQTKLAQQELQITAATKHTHYQHNVLVCDVMRP